MMPHDETPFDPDFSGPSDWARMYRRNGIQVVPAHYPMTEPNHKRPPFAWKEFQNELVSDAIFDKWFSREAKPKPNMGMITGAASGNLLCIDLDDYKNKGSGQWFAEIMGPDPETWTQRTGGGGRQMFFRLPDGVSLPNGASEALGVDIRGQGGFAMLPPSEHLSGNDYAWLPGCAPWECDLDIAPQRLIDAVQQITGTISSDNPEQPHVKTASPGNSTDEWGNITDGREEYMTRIVWAAVVDMYRESPIFSPIDDVAAMKAAFETYERKTKSRINQPGTPNHILLEREGRGISLFRQKWQYAARQWDGKVREAAGQTPKPEPEPEKWEGDQEGEPENAATNTFELLDVKAIKAMPDPKWLVSGLIPEQGMGFIFGAPGAGKSFVALGMALSVACQLPEWWGRQIEKAGPVVYISSEGHTDLKFRIQAWEAATGQKADAAPFMLIRQSINFMSADDVAKLIRTVQIVADSAANPALVFVDTVSRVLPGADENLQKDMTLFIQACDLVRDKFGSTVVGVHHTSRSGNLRGSSVFDGAGDFLARVEREEGEEVGSLVAQKIKAAPDGWKQAFRLREYAVSMDKTSLYAEPAIADITASKPSDWPDIQTCRAALSLIDAAWNKRQPLSFVPQAKRQGRYAPNVINSSLGVAVPLASKMLERWLTEGIIAAEIWDTHSKARGLRMVEML